MTGRLAIFAASASFGLRRTAHRPPCLRLFFMSMSRDMEGFFRQDGISVFESPTDPIERRLLNPGFAHLAAEFLL
jgi:hypothetical protein